MISKQLLISLIANCMLIVVLYFVCVDLKFYKKGVSDCAILTDSLRLELTMLKGNIKLHYCYNEKYLKDFDLIDEEGDTILISSLLDEREKFVYKFSLFNCSSCITHELSLINHFKNILDNRNAFIIIDSCSVRDLSLFKRYNPIMSVPIYRMATTTNDMNQILKEEETPFVLFMNNSLQVKDLFVPIKEYPHYSEEYHKEMFYKYSIL